jgi:hypothetical protein
MPGQYHLDLTHCYYITNWQFRKGGKQESLGDEMIFIHQLEHDDPVGVLYMGFSGFLVLGLVLKVLKLMLIIRMTLLKNKGDTKAELVV